MFGPVKKVPPGKGSSAPARTTAALMRGSVQQELNDDAECGHGTQRMTGDANLVLVQEMGVRACGVIAEPDQLGDDEADVPGLVDVVAACAGSIVLESGKVGAATTYPADAHACSNTA